LVGAGWPGARIAGRAAFRGFTDADHQLIEEHGPHHPPERPALHLPPAQVLTSEQDMAGAVSQLQHV